MTTTHGSEERGEAPAASTGLIHPGRYHRGLANPRNTLPAGRLSSRWPSCASTCLLCTLVVAATDGKQPQTNSRGRTGCPAVAKTRRGYRSQPGSGRQPDERVAPDPLYPGRSAPRAEGRLPPQRTPERSVLAAHTGRAQHRAWYVPRYFGCGISIANPDVHSSSPVDPPMRRPWADRLRKSFPEKGPRRAPAEWPDTLLRKSVAPAERELLHNGSILAASARSAGGRGWQCATRKGIRPNSSTG